MAQSGKEANKKKDSIFSESKRCEGKSPIEPLKITNTVLLAIIIILLICQLIIGNSALPTTTIPLDEGDKSDTSGTALVPVSIQTSTTLPVSISDSDMEYEYGAVSIDREKMAYAEREHKAKNPKAFGPIEIPSYYLHIGGYKGWDYVGILCNDGINGSWILVRRKKETEKTNKY